MSVRDTVGQILGPAKPLAIWTISQLILRKRGVKCDLRVDACSKQPSLSFGNNIKISTGTVLGGGSIHLSDGVSVGKECILRGNVKVGRETNLVHGNRIVGDVAIGNYCAFASGATIQQRDHDVSRASLQGKFYSQHEFSELETADSGQVKIGNDVWLGLNSTVVSGVSIGDGAVIGANALVSRDVRPYEIVGGNPAEHIGWRFCEEVRDTLQELAWWEWDKDRIRRNDNFFTTEISGLSVEEIHSLIVE
ncbi:MAG: CatB-related O-acetyltransferase [Halopenitus sp.]